MPDSGFDPPVAHPARIYETRIEQFLDIGSGLPTAANTHEVAQAIEPGARLAQPQQWRLPHDPDPGTPIPPWCGVAVKP
jgi:hypothetical protein